MGKPDIKTIRKAICANRGGHENASDEQIMLIWNALPPEVQEQYLKTIEGKGKKDAVSDKTKSDL